MGLGSATVPAPMQPLDSKKEMERMDGNGPARTWPWTWPYWPQGQFLRPWADPNQRFAYGLDGPMGITGRPNQTYAYAIILGIIIQ